MRIRITQVTDVRLTLRPGDELVVVSGEERIDVQRLLQARRIDDARVCEVMGEPSSDEIHDPVETAERAVVRTSSRARGRSIAGEVRG